MKEKWLFTDEEVKFLRKQWKLPEIQRIIQRTGKDSPLQPIANALCPLFRAHCKKPYPGETEEQFKKRLRNKTKEQKEQANRIPRETRQQFKARLAELPARMYKWVNYQHNTASKRSAAKEAKASTPPPVQEVAIIPVPRPRAPRKRSGLEMFMKDAERPAVTEGRFFLAKFRKDCMDQYADLTPDEMAEYEAQAEELNEQLVREVSTQVSGPDAALHLSADDVANWLDRMLDVLHDQLGWAGAIVVGGPGMNGDPVHYISERGKTREDQLLLDALRQLGKWTPQEFEGVVGLWLEHCRADTEPGEVTQFVLDAEQLLDEMRDAPSAPAATSLGSAVRPTGRATSEERPAQQPSTPTTPSRIPTATSTPRATPRSGHGAVVVPRPSFTIIQDEPEASGPGDAAPSDSEDEELPAVRRGRPSKAPKKKKETAGIMMPVPDPASETLTLSRAPRERRVKDRYKNNDGLTVLTATNTASAGDTASKKKATSNKKRAAQGGGGRAKRQRRQ